MTLYDHPKMNTFVNFMYLSIVKIISTGVNENWNWIALPVNDINKIKKKLLKI